MHRLTLAYIMLSVFLVTAPAAAQPYHSRPGGDVDISIFYEELGPYGEWIDLPPYGWVWSPYGVDYDWRPYQEGHWVWTEYGWTWVSDEPFGWAVYHYGRWHYDNYYGWIWVPGTIWVRRGPPGAKVTGGSVGRRSLPTIRFMWAFEWAVSTSASTRSSDFTGTSSNRGAFWSRGFDRTSPEVCATSTSSIRRTM